VPRPSRAIRESGLSESALVCQLVLLIALLVAATACGPAPAPGERDRQPPTATLAVETFTVTDSAPKKWDADLFADSVAARLKLMDGISVARRDTPGTDTDFVLRGGVSSRNDRLVIGVRLLRRNDPTPAWTATFWRGEGPISRLVEDVATGVAEALGAEIARLSVLKGAKR